ncbi:hypothetical protein VNO80_25015 [Phaseolus coccineus]|uniref:Uncharacterized protein n=1 Tax=Phaseolus coccineus TaxID=3886 RepID=A0AAN9LTT1_PHACN
MNMESRFLSELEQNSVHEATATATATATTTEKHLEGDVRLGLHKFQIRVQSSSPIGRPLKPVISLLLSVPEIEQNLFVLILVKLIDGINVFN